MFGYQYFKEVLEENLRHANNNDEEAKNGIYHILNFCFKISMMKLLKILLKQHMM